MWVSIGLNKETMQWSTLKKCQEGFAVPVVGGTLSVLESSPRDETHSFHVLVFVELKKLHLYLTLSQIMHYITQSNFKSPRWHE